MNVNILCCKFVLKNLSSSSSSLSSSSANDSVAAAANDHVPRTTKELHSFSKLSSSSSSSSSTTNLSPLSPIELPPSTASSTKNNRFLNLRLPFFLRRLPPVFFKAVRRCRHLNLSTHGRRRRVTPSMEQVFSPLLILRKFHTYRPHEYNAF